MMVPQLSIKQECPYLFLKSDTEIYKNEKLPGVSFSITGSLDKVSG